MIFSTQVGSFIPEFWSAQLQISMNANAVVSSNLCTNRDYDGDARSGSKVWINSLVDPTVSEYVGAPITTNRLQTNATELPIDQGDYFSFTLKDVERFQMIGELAATATAQAGQKLIEASDLFVGSQMLANAGAKDIAISIPAGTNAGDALYESIVDDIVTVLDENRIPEDGRFLVVTPRVKAMLLKSSRFIDASQYGSSEPIRNGVIGRFAGFTVQMSTNLPKTSGAYTSDIIAGHPMATTFAEQIEEVESLRDPEDFGSIIRGLHVYGAKVIRPEALATAKVTIAA
ncbi:phage major capsid protein [Streptosporangium pseudovulgare]|uniref:Bacteriophage protein n=1 Tax=Streptosporangium pseudovulgare TaxID=35765 RepID=A0ABQ2QJA8_9ACTN|nr:phage capsid protein [Streptosporangium pseudovulgare]GGP84460.1 bacteriophage protein [Streptosporangium pseudovulgare]